MENLLIAIVIGFVIALIVVLVMKSQLKSVRRQNEARYYEKNGGLTLSDSRDIYLYNTIRRTPRPKNNDKK